MPPEIRQVARPPTPTGRPPGTRNLVGPGEEALLVDQHMNGQIGVAEIDRPSRALLDEGAEGTLDFGRGHRKALFRSLAANCETLGSHIFETRPEVAFEVLDRLASELHRSDPADAEDRRQAARRFGKENGLLEGDQNPPCRSCHRRHRQIGEGVAHIVGEGALEPATVAALEADLRCGCENAGHRFHRQRVALGSRLRARLRLRARCARRPPFETLTERKPPRRVGH